MKQKIQLKAGFTLIEVLIVATIISLLASVGITSYTSFNQNSRDARRKADLEQIRGALELYRSNNSTYPTASGTYGLPFGTAGLSDATNTYMSKIPNDPKNGFTYFYTLSSGEYTIGALLEGSSTCAAAAGTDCQETAGTQNCNYCIGPYGQK